jgi:hypothetical protein
MQSGFYKVRDCQVALSMTKSKNTHRLGIEERSNTLYKVVLQVRDCRAALAMTILLF